MAKEGTLKKTMKKIGKATASYGINTIKNNINSTIEDVKKKIEKTVEYVLKTIAVFMIVILGFIFVLVGFSKYLSETVPAFDHGVGYIVVGGGLIFLGIIVRWLTPRK